MVPIPGYERYLISRSGDVYATHLSKYLSQYDNGIGYLAVKLSDGKSRRQFYVHRLVAAAYLNLTSTELDVNHIDGIKTNNCVENLEVVTHQVNMKHAFDNGLLRGFIVKHYSGCLG